MSARNAGAADGFLGQAVRAEPCGWLPVGAGDGLKVGLGDKVQPAHSAIGQRHADGDVEAARAVGPEGVCGGAG